MKTQRIEALIIAIALVVMGFLLKQDLPVSPAGKESLT